MLRLSYDRRQVQGACGGAFGRILQKELLAGPRFASPTGALSTEMSSANPWNRSSGIGPLFWVSAKIVKTICGSRLRGQRRAAAQ